MAQETELTSISAAPKPDPDGDNMLLIVGEAEKGEVVRCVISRAAARDLAHQLVAISDHLDSL